MGVGIIPSLEKPIKGVNPYIEGKALARAYAELDELAEDLDLLGISELGDAYADEDEEPWYDANAGLETIAGLLKHLRSDPSSVPDSDYVINDLEECETILKAAVENETRFCFTMVE